MGRAAAHQQRVAVRLCACDQSCAQVSSGARTVLDDDRLSEHRRQPLADHAGENIGGASRSG
jgi:hypothetical protein